MTVDMAFKLLMSRKVDSFMRLLEELGIARREELVEVGSVEIVVQRAPLRADYVFAGGKIILVEAKSEGDRVDDRELYRATYKLLGLAEKYGISPTELTEKGRVIFIVPLRQNILARYRHLLTQLTKGFYMMKGTPICTYLLILKEAELPPDAVWLKILYHEGRMELIEIAKRTGDIYIVEALLISGDKEVVLRVILEMAEAAREAWRYVAEKLGPKRVAEVFPLEILLREEARDAWKHVAEKLGPKRVAEALPLEVLLREEVKDAWRQAVERVGIERALRALPLELLFTDEGLKVLSELLRQLPEEKRRKIIRLLARNA